MKYSLSILALLLFSCAGVNTVVTLGDGNYYVASSGTMGWSSGGEQKAKSISKAEEFCKEKGKVLKIIKSSDSGAGGFGKISTGDVEFTCQKESWIEKLF